MGSIFLMWDQTQTLDLILVGEGGCVKGLMGCNFLVL